MAKTKIKAKPKVGERTTAQPPRTLKGAGVYGPYPPGFPNQPIVPTGELAATINPQFPYHGFGYVGGTGEGFKAFDPPPPGTLELYRKMARTPTIAIGLSVPVCRTINNEWSWKKRDEGDSDDDVAIIERWFEPQRLQIVRDGMMALRYGCSQFEKAYELIDPVDLGLTGEKWMLPRLKPLRVDYTTFLADEALRKVIGLRNRPPYAKDDTDLMLDKSFWYTFGGEAGDPYGESLLENLREVWAEADAVRKKISRYMNKISGVIGQIHYPEGTSKNASGTDTPNYQLAQQLAAAASEGKWLVMANRFASFIVDPQNVTPASLEKALAAAGKAEWVVSFVDPGGTDHSGGFKELLQYYDVLMVRGLLQPERSLLETQGGGSRADSMTHGEIGVLFPEVLITDFVLNFNKHCLDDVLEMNGRVRGSIYAEPDPISDDEYDAKLKTLHAGLQSPDVGPGIAQKIDYDQLCDDLGVPIHDDERGKPLDIISQLMPPELKLPKPPGRNGNGPRTAPVGRSLEGP